MTPSNWRQLVERFKRVKTLVIGDLMLDHYIWGSVSRISPEAPVPVVSVSRESEMPGGAGNVALNMAFLGAEVYVVGLVGNDSPADRLLSLLQRGTIQTSSIVRAPERPTTVKTRIVAHNQQVVRVDREMKTDLGPALRATLWEQVLRVLPLVQAVVLSDYGKGVVNASLIDALIPLARRRGLPIVVDPKIENFASYKHVTCVTPNLQEAQEGTGMRRLQTDKDLDRLGLQILKQLKTQSVLITRGERGMSLFEKHKPALHIPTRAREVYDVTGAGDTVVSTLTLALAAGAPLRAAAELANYAAGIVVGKIGTAAVSSEELLRVVKGNGHG